MAKVLHIDAPSELTKTYVICCDATIHAKNANYFGLCGKPASNVAVYTGRTSKVEVEVYYCNKHYRELFR